MQKILRATMGLAAAAALSITLVACAGSAQQESPSTDAEAPAKVTKLSISIPPVGDSLPVFVAIDQGFFAANNLEVELVPAANGATAVNSLISQSTDIALISYPTLINAHAAGLPVTTAAVGIDGTKEYQSAIYTVKDSPITTLEQLQGKAVAVPSLNSVGDIFLSGEFLANGLDPATIKYVELPQANMAAALAAGDVDAVFMGEPTLSATLKTMELRPIVIQEGPQGLFATSVTLLETRPEVIKAFRAALAEGVAYIEADPHGVAGATLPNHTKLDTQTATNMNLPFFGTEWNASGVQANIDLMVELGIVDKSFPSTDLYIEL